MIELIKEILFGVNDPNIQYAIAPWLMAVTGAAQVLSGWDWGGKRRKALARARRAYEAQKEVYKGLDTSNPFSELTNPYRDMENTAEDLRVNTQAADFQRQMFRQQQADTLSQFRGAAGASGIAGLAQVMANQAQTQSQRIAADIAQQEAANRKLVAMQAARLQEMEAKGQFMTDTTIMKGELGSMQMEQSKQATLLGMDAQMVSGAQKAVQAGQQMMAQGFGNLAGGFGEAWDPTTKSFKFFE